MSRSFLRNFEKFFTEGKWGKGGRIRLHFIFESAQTQKKSDAKASDFFWWGRTDSLFCGKATVNVKREGRIRLHFCRWQKLRSCRHRAGGKQDSTGVLHFTFESLPLHKTKQPIPKGISCFVVGEDGFEPSKRNAADLQSVPFGHSGTPPYLISVRSVWSR